MNPESENWFAKHRNLVFGAAVVVLILNLALLLVTPNVKVVTIEEETPEYCTEDLTAGITHTLMLNGTLRRTVFSAATFVGTLSIDGSEPFTLQFVRRDGSWAGKIPDSAPVSAVFAGKGFDEIVLILADDTTRFLAPGAVNARAAHVRLRSYEAPQS